MSFVELQDISMLQTLMAVLSKLLGEDEAKMILENV